MNKFFAFRLAGWKQTAIYFFVWLVLYIVINQVAPAFLPEETSMASFVSGIKWAWIIIIFATVYYKNRKVGKKNPIVPPLVAVVISVIVGGVFAGLAYEEQSDQVALLGYILTSLYIFIFYNPKFEQEQQV